MPDTFDPTKSEFYPKNKGHLYDSPEFKEFQLALISNLSEEERQEYKKWEAKVIKLVGLVIRVDSQPSEILVRREIMRLGVKIETLHREIETTWKGGNPACSWEEFNRLEDIYYSIFWETFVGPRKSGPLPGKYANAE